MAGDYPFFDIIAFLEEHSISYSTEGTKNVGRGWIGLKCCFCSDYSNHLGVPLDSGGIFSCMKCGEKGGVAKLVKTLLDVEWVEAYQEVERFSAPSGPRKDPKPLNDKRWKPKSLPIPSYFSKTFSKRHLEYLAKRGFNPYLLIEKYDLYACHAVGPFRWRIVAPIILDGNVVNFVGRDITGKAERKYLLENNDRAVLPRRHIAYNLDNVRDGACLIVEGPADVWRIGDGAIAFFGTKVSPEQAWMLFDHGIRRCSILFDPEPEAQRLARRLGAQLSGIMDSVTILEKQTPGDPGDMSPDEVVKLRREVFT